jgi:hypothetical protein
MAEGSWFTTRIRSSLGRERYVDMQLGLTTKAELMEVEQFFCERKVLLCDCTGLVAHLCNEYREETTLPNGFVLPAIAVGLKFKVTNPGKPTF